MNDNKTKSLDELVRKERREYIRAWRAKHPEKVKEQNRLYWERKALRRLAAEQGQVGAGEE